MNAGHPAPPRPGDETTTGPRSGRRLDVDALRVGACLTQFIFHTGKVFDTDPVYHVKNALLSPAMTAVTTFTHLWRMPLFFLIAGWATVVVLRRRSSATFLKERARRLLPPLIFGIVLLCPPIKYIERLGGIDNRPSGAAARTDGFGLTFWEFLPRFFGNLRDFSWSHMWFLVYLLLFLPLLVPVLRIMERPGGRLGADRRAVYLPVVPLILLEAVLRPLFGDFPNLYADWANIAVYLTYFLLGALLAREPHLEAAVAAEWWRLGLLALSGLVLMSGFEAVWLRPVAHVFATWGMVGFLVGGARRWWRRDAVWLRYLSDATLPLYVLHHTPLVLLAFFIVPLALPVWMKAAAVFVGSILATFLLYHLAVRPWQPMRFLLGMRPRPKDPR